MSKYLKIKSPNSDQAYMLAADYDLTKHGLQYHDTVYWNLSTPALYEEIIFRNEGRVVNQGPVLINTGKHTARAANDKFFAKEETTADDIWWSEYNVQISIDKYDTILARAQSYVQGKDLFVQDCYAGNDPDYRLAVRVITGQAWQSLFARNMLITPTEKDEFKNFIPEFTLLALPDFRTVPEIDGTNSDTGIVINFKEKIAIVANSLYGGEIKKSIFTVLNFLLTFKNVLPMHCSANVGKNDEAALFFGLSGTGKTTLSADPNRFLIGDDEHGWSANGIFNFEGGCYAKVIRLSEKYEPEIYACTKKFGTILENVVFDEITRKIDLDDDKYTENTRASYPLHYIPNTVPGGMVNAHPKNIIFLTCDASGVMPPIARLNPDQAQYHFISGYTSKVGGTEKGVGKAPKITFSACFGAPFMVRHPSVYAGMLKERMQKHDAQCWLVNTGWVGGEYGVGERISIHHTRNLLNAALDKKLEKVEFRKDKLFGFEVPVSCPDVPEEILEPSNSWKNKQSYWDRYDSLAEKFIQNFKRFIEQCDRSVIEAGPIRLK